MFRMLWKNRRENHEFCLMDAWKTPQRWCHLGCSRRMHRPRRGKDSHSKRNSRCRVEWYRGPRGGPQGSLPPAVHVLVVLLLKVPHIENSHPVQPTEYCQSNHV